MSGIVAQNLNRQSGLIKAPEAAGGAWTFISKTTASSSATLSITSGLDSTYKVYLFTFNNIHAGTSGGIFSFNGSIDSGSNYNVAKTTTFWRAYHDEADGYTGLGYDGGGDLAQGTGFLPLVGDGVGIDNDQCNGGTMYLYNTKKTVFVKHFIARINNMYPDDYATDTYSSGYLNTTSAIDAVQFKMNSGNIDSGDICLYGLTI